MDTNHSFYEAPCYAGLFCLDFINTAPHRHPDAAREYLNSYYDFIDWCQQVGLIEMEYNNHLTLEANYQISDRKKAYDNVRCTRQLLDDLFNAVVTGKPPRPCIAERFTQAVAEASSHLKYKVTEGILTYEWDCIPEELELPRWLLVKEAADVLLNYPPGTLKMCPVCRSFYADRTKNRTRRWCHVSTCGSKATNRRYYKSHKRLEAGT